MTSQQTLVQKIVRDLAKWYIKHRKPITSRSLKPILERHIATQQGIEEMVDYLSTKAGEKEFHSAIDAELKIQLGK